MAALGGSTPARRGVCVPRALLTQPPENVNVGRAFLISLLFFILPLLLPSRLALYLYRSVRPRARARATRGIQSVDDAFRRLSP